MVQSVLSIFYQQNILKFSSYCFFSKSVQVLAPCRKQLFIKSEGSLLVDIRICRSNPRLELNCTFSSHGIMLPIQLKCSTLSSCFSSIIFRTLNFPNSFPFHNFFQYQSFYQSRRVAAFSSLVSSVSSSAYFTVRITCTILKNRSPSRASLVKYSLYKLNRVGDKQNSSLNHLPFFALLVSSWSSHTLTLNPSTVC
jgi:hypothetical protein